MGVTVSLLDYVAGGNITSLVTFDNRVFQVS
jgi:hypothetical protein